MAGPPGTSLPSWVSALARWNDDPQAVTWTTLTRLAGAGVWPSTVCRWLVISHTVPSRTVALIAVRGMDAAVSAVVMSAALHPRW